MKRISLIYYFLLIIIGIQAQNLSPQQDKKGRWGYVDATGNIVIKCKYDEAQSFKNGVAIVRDGTKYGFIDENGKAIGKGIAYSSITEFVGTTNYLVSIGGKKSDKANIQKSRKNLNVENFAGSCLLGIENAKWGIISNKGDVVIPVEYAEISSLKDGIAYIIKNDKWGLIGMDMKFIVEPQKYTLISDFCDKGVALVQIGKKNGVINKDGKVILEPNWEKVVIMPTEDSIYVQPTNNIYEIPAVALGYIMYANKYLKRGSYTLLCDMNGKVIVPEGRLTYMGKPSEGVVIGWVWKSKKKQSIMLDLTNGMIFDLPTNDKSWYNDFEYGASIGNDGEKYYFVGRDGKRCSDYYSYLGKQKEGHRIVKKYGDSKFGVIDSLRNVVVPLIYDDTKNFVSHGLLGVAQNDKWGFVNMKGEVVTELKYHSVGMHEKGAAAVCDSINGKKLFGVIDVQNNLLIPISWDDASYYIEDGQKLKKAWVKLNDKYSLYDVMTSEIRYENEFDEPIYNGGYWYMRKGDKWGLLDVEGKILIPIAFSGSKQLQIVVEELKKNGTPTMSYIDAYRTDLKTSGIANNQKLDDIINDNLWDF